MLWMVRKVFRNGRSIHVLSKEDVKKRHVGDRERTDSKLLNEERSSCSSLRPTPSRLDSYGESPPIITKHHDNPLAVHFPTLPRTRSISPNMKVLGLLSGGKDSCYNLMHCIANGHEVVALATLVPEEGVGE